MTTWDRITTFASKLASAPIPRVTALSFNDSGAQSDRGTRELQRNQEYFGLTINEIFLAKGREWWSSYDPLVYVCVDFAYGRERISVPMLVGPSALRGRLPANDMDLPHGFVVQDVRVLGPQVFRGGPVDVTIILYKVRRDDYAKQFLGFAESISNAIGIPAEISSVIKIGGTIVDAMEALLRIGDVEPIVGHRVGLNASPLTGLRTQSVALLAGECAESATARVVDGRLESRASGDAFRSQDHVLYSLWGMQYREVPDALPLFGLVDKMLECASAGDDDSWARAKSILVTLYQQMLISPDLTAKDADSLFDDYKQKIVRLREESKRVQLMSVGKQEGRLLGQTASTEARLNQRSREVLALPT